MTLERICVLYFSPTGGTEKIARFIAGELAVKLRLEQKFIDFTKLENRQIEYSFGRDDLLIMASPVYAGRLPNKLVTEYKTKILGHSTPAISLCVFGNRNFDEALGELAMLLEDNSFQIVGAAAFAGRHAFTDKVGGGRPDEDDFAQMRDFSTKVAEKLTQDSLPALEIDRSEVGPYYTPLKEDGNPAKFLKTLPQTNLSKCIHCGLCVRSCPLGSIDKETIETVGICIKCQACVKCCPTHAKYFSDPDFISHVAMLEQNYTRRAANKIII